MDPVTVFSLFCGVVHTVEAAIKTGQTLAELYKSSNGFSKETESLLSMADSLKSAVGELRDTHNHLQPPSSALNPLGPPVGTQLLTVASECATLANQIEALLDKCRVKKRSSILAAGSAMVRSIRYKSEITQLQEEMKASRDSLNLAIAIATRTELLSLKRQFKSFGQKQSDICKKLDGISGELQSTPDLGGLLNEIRRLRTVSEEGLDEINHHVILHALRPMTADVRFDEVRDPESDTFEWIFQQPQRLFEFESKLDTTIPDWLGRGSGVFHIAGKPGSGKSTLLKFIAQHEETVSLLEQWAHDDGKKLIFSKFFFWKIGSSEQKTMRGLIRGLLYDIVRHYPEITRVLFPDHWNPRGFLSQSSRAHEINLYERDITTAFNTLIKHPEVLQKFRVCIFIDGLDEFDEKDISHAELATTLLKWTTATHSENQSTSNVKLCVSSRELPSIIRPFSDRQRITLHNLTQSDIRELVQTRLGTDQNFQDLAFGDPGRAEALLDGIATEASGVFLWVVLLLKLLIEDVSSGASSLGALERIVGSSPGELGEFFQRIVDSIPRHHLRGAYLIFSMMLRCLGIHLAQDASDADTRLRPFKFRNTISQISLIGLSTLFHSFESTTQSIFDRITVQPCEDLAEYCSRIRKTSINLMSWCRGLIDITWGALKSPEEPGFPIAIFTHRSIPEYLLERLRSESEGLGLTEEIVSRYLLTTYHAELESAYLPITTEEIKLRVHSALDYVRSRPIVSRELYQILDEMDRSFSKLHERQNRGKKGESFDVSGWGVWYCWEESFYFTTMAAEVGLHEFLSWKLNHDRTFRNDRVRLAGAMWATLRELWMIFAGKQLVSLSARHSLKAMSVCLDSAIFSPQLLDHDAFKIPAFANDLVTRLNVSDWLQSFDKQSLLLPTSERVCITEGMGTLRLISEQDHTSDKYKMTSANYGTISVTPWRLILNFFIEIIIVSTKGRLLDELWQCLEYWLSVSVSVPTAIYTGAFVIVERSDVSESERSIFFHPDGSIRKFWIGFELHKFCHKHEKDELQLSASDLPQRLTGLRDSSWPYLIERLGSESSIFPDGETVMATTLESFVRYHQPSNQERLLEHIGRQIPLHGRDGTNPDSIWGLQRIIEEMPQSYYNDFDVRPYIPFFIPR